MKRNVLVAHGGGPTTVINASLFGVVDEALKYDQIGTVYGAVHGVEGVLKEELIDLSAVSRAQIDLLPHTPSSALGSCRHKVSEDEYPRILEVLKKYNIGYFFYNGGNDSMDTCDKINRLCKEAGYEICAIGIPKTIDNDLAMTDHTPGFGSAARFIANNTRDLWMEVRAMPLYVTILETMGRNAGWLAASAAMAEYNGKPCAQLVYLPEITFDMDRFLGDVDGLLKKQREILIVVSEGLTDSTGNMISDQGFVDGFGHKLAGGVAQTLRDSIQKNLGASARAERHGFLGRASMVMQSDVDREEAIAVGRRAIQLAMQGETGLMVTLQRTSDAPYCCELGTAPLHVVANEERFFPMEWLNEAKNGVTDDFKKYCAPLLGKPFTPYTIL